MNISTGNVELIIYIKTGKIHMLELHFIFVALFITLVCLSDPTPELTQNLPARPSPCAAGCNSDPPVSIHVTRHSVLKNNY